MPAIARSSDETHRAHVLADKRRTADVATAPDEDGAATTFSGLLLSAPVLSGLTAAGFVCPSPIQQRAIPLGRCGLDLIVQAKSGTGKTCVLAVLAIEQLVANSGGGRAKHCVSVVVTPTREVALQVASVIASIGSHIPVLRVCTLIGGTSVSEDAANCRHCHIVVATPGRLKHVLEAGHLETQAVRLFVLDEADRLMHDNFADDVNYIYTRMPAVKQMLAISATYPDNLAQLLARYMRSPHCVRLNKVNQSLVGVGQFVVQVQQSCVRQQQHAQQLATLLQLLATLEFTQCLVFTNYQTRAETLCAQLVSAGWSVDHLTAGLTQQKRQLAVQRLHQLQCRVLVASDVAARGLDCSHVDLVVNVDVPADAATWLHRAGRAGRFGSAGACVTLLPTVAQSDVTRLVRAVGDAGVCLRQLSLGQSDSRLCLRDADLASFPPYSLPSLTAESSVTSRDDVTVDSSVCVVDAAAGDGQDEVAGRRVLKARRRRNRESQADEDEAGESERRRLADVGWQRAVCDRNTRASHTDRPQQTEERASPERRDSFDELLRQYRLSQLERDARDLAHDKEMLGGENEATSKQSECDAVNDCQNGDVDKDGVVDEDCVASVPGQLDQDVCSAVSSQSPERAESDTSVNMSVVRDLFTTLRAPNQQESIGAEEMNEMRRYLSGISRRSGAARVKLTGLAVTLRDSPKAWAVVRDALSSASDCDHLTIDWLTERLVQSSGGSQDSHTEEAPAVCSDSAQDGHAAEVAEESSQHNPAPINALSSTLSVESDGKVGECGRDAVSVETTGLAQRDVQEKAAQSCVTGDKAVLDGDVGDVEVGPVQVNDEDQLAFQLRLRREVVARRTLSQQSVLSSQSALPLLPAAQPGLDSHQDRGASFTALSPPPEWRRVEEHERDVDGARATRLDHADRRCSVHDSARIDCAPRPCVSALRSGQIHSGCGRSCNGCLVRCVCGGRNEQSAGANYCYDTSQGHHRLSNVPQFCHRRQHYDVSEYYHVYWQQMLRRCHSQQTRYMSHMLAVMRQTRISSHSDPPVA